MTSVSFANLAFVLGRIWVGVGIVAYPRRPLHRRCQGEYQTHGVSTPRANSFITLGFMVSKGGWDSRSSPAEAMSHAFIACSNPVP